MVNLRGTNDKGWRYTYINKDLRPAKIPRGRTFNANIVWILWVAVFIFGYILGSFK